MASSSEEKAPAPQVQQVAQLVPRLISKADAHVAHTIRLLSTTPRLDTTLLTLTYTIHLLHSVLVRLTIPSTLKPPSSALYPTRLIRLTTSLAALNAIIDDVRIFLRLPALLSIYAWGSSLYKAPPKDSVLRAIAWTQVIACAFFQGLENGAYLGSKGVIDLARLPGADIGGVRGLVGNGTNRIQRWYVWSARFWMIHVSMEFVRLARSLQLRNREILSEAKAKLDISKESAGGAGESEEARRAESGVALGGGEDKALVSKREAEAQEWWKKVYVNSAYLPLTVHYGTEGGVFAEASSAVLNLVPGLFAFRDAWRATA